MKRWIRKLKVWAIRKLGGYTADEATHNRKIQRLSRTHIYSAEMIKASLCDVHLAERKKALQYFVDGLAPYVKIEEHFDPNRHEWALRTSLRVVDEDIF